jgi:NADH dehydrogenase FAD-containing subunit
VVIVGGGYSGVELAANLAATLGRDRSVSFDIVIIIIII